jgi:hypothetical protein
LASTLEQVKLSQATAFLPLCGWEEEPTLRFDTDSLKGQSWNSDEA